MWLALVFAFILYKVLRLFFGDDDVLDVETSDFNALFAVSARLLFPFYFLSPARRRLPPPRVFVLPSLIIIIVFTKLD